MSNAEQRQAERVAGWMLSNVALREMIERTARGEEQGTLSDSEHKIAIRRAKLALDVYAGRL